MLCASDPGAPWIAKYGILVARDCTDSRLVVGRLSSVQDKRESLGMRDVSQAFVGRFKPWKTNTEREKAPSGRYPKTLIMFEDSCPEFEASPKTTGMLRSTPGAAAQQSAHWGR